MKIKQGDYVQVIAGKDVGKRGKVLRTFSHKDKVVVEGLNYVHKHLKKSQQNPQGGRIEKEAAIHVSNVMLYSVHYQKTTRSRSTYEMKESE
ncbi:50S ribosomal protein L24 [Candidatus Uabimicrobium sp. HlEnr_7]|uniref:50S ribosomal protein L24 n=1 Tax=Candidatus Uabimicrobium helgolandensis TaxID=3095367 RepID=UPI003558359D